MLRAELSNKPGDESGLRPGDHVVWDKGTGVYFSPVRATVAIPRSLAHRYGRVTLALPPSCIRAGHSDECWFKSFPVVSDEYLDTLLG